MTDNLRHSRWGDSPWDSVMPIPFCGCVIWMGALHPSGYGLARHDGKCMNAHRAAWLRAGRDIPAGYTIDHLCRVKSCVNVDHLETVTRSENSKRTKGHRKTGPIKERCPQGHPYTEDNTEFRKDARGRLSRRCRRCHSERESARGLAGRLARRGANADG